MSLKWHSRDHKKVYILQQESEKNTQPKVLRHKFVANILALKKFQQKNKLDFWNKGN